jgi:hypothetical protein
LSGCNILELINNEPTQTMRSHQPRVRYQIEPQI